MVTRQVVLDFYLRPLKMFGPLFYKCHILIWGLPSIYIISSKNKSSTADRFMKLKQMGVATHLLSRRDWSKLRGSVLSYYLLMLVHGRLCIKAVDSRFGLVRPWDHDNRISRAILRFCLSLNGEGEIFGKAIALPTLPEPTPMRISTHISCLYLLSIINVFLPVELQKKQLTVYVQDLSFQSTLLKKCTQSSFSWLLGSPNLQFRYKLLLPSDQTYNPSLLLSLSPIQQLTEFEVDLVAYRREFSWEFFTDARS